MIKCKVVMLSVPKSAAFIVTDNLYIGMLVADFAEMINVGSSTTWSRIRSNARGGEKHHPQNGEVLREG